MLKRACKPATQLSLSVRLLRTMTRSQKHYQRLEQLEIEFKELLISELTKIVKDGHRSMYLPRRVPGAYTGKIWQSKEIAEIERVEQNIIKLRGKLNEPVPGEFLSMLHEYDEEIRKSIHAAKYEVVARAILQRIEKQSNKAL